MLTLSFVEAANYNILYGILVSLSPPVLIISPFSHARSGKLTVNRKMKAPLNEFTRRKKQDTELKYKSYLCVCTFSQLHFLAQIYFSSVQTGDVLFLSNYDRFAVNAFTGVSSCTAQSVSSEGPHSIA